MKLSKKILAAVSIVAFAAFAMLPLASCSDDGDSGGQSTQQPSSTDNGEGEGEKTGGEGDGTGGDNGDTTPHATLPESVGANPFAGKTWEYFASGFQERHFWEFSDTTARHIVEETVNDKVEIHEGAVYNYSYNADENLLYLALKTYIQTDDGEEWSYASLEDFKKLAEAWGWFSVEIELELERVEQEFSLLKIKKYTIDGNTLKLENYFDGSLPSAYQFYKSFRADELPDGYSGELGIDYMSINMPSGSEFKCFYSLSFDGTAFSGRVYDEDANTLGTISGTYTTSGSGTAESGCTVTLNFTSIPSGIPVIVTGKDYVLEMSERYEYTYTLVSE